METQNGNKNTHLEYASSTLEGNTKHSMTHSRKQVETADSFINFELEERNIGLGCILHTHPVVIKRKTSSIKVV